MSISKLVTFKNKKIYYEKAQYHLWERLFSRIFDLFLFVFIGFCILLLVINYKLGYFFTHLSSYVLPFWQISLFCTCIFLLDVIYFIIVPFFTNGQTFAKKLFKLKILLITRPGNWDVTNKITWSALIKRELLLTLTINFLFFLSPFIILLSTLGGNQTWEQFILHAINNNSNWVLVVLSGLNLGFFSLLIINFATVLFTKKKIGVYENWSKTEVVKLVANKKELVRVPSKKENLEPNVTLMNKKFKKLNKFPAVFSKTQELEIDNLLNHEQ